MKAVSLLSCIAVSLCTPDAFADGGAVVWTGERLGQRAAVVVAPAAPRVGVVEISWIGIVDEGAFVRATHEDGSVGIAPLFRQVLDGEVRAVLELSKYGQWSVELDPDGDSEAEPARFSIEVAPSLPPWSAHLLELFIWIPLVAIALFAAHRRSLRASFPMKNTARHR